MCSVTDNAVSIKKLNNNNNIKNKWDTSSVLVTLHFADKYNYSLKKL